MDFNLSEAQEAVQKQARSFAQDVLRPTAQARQAAHGVPHDIVRQLADMGLLGVNVPLAHGGAAKGAIAYAVALREIAGGDASVAVTMAVTNMVAEVICRFGTAQQQTQFVRPLTSGTYFAGAFALSEPMAGSDPASMQTQAQPATENGVAGYRINGQKLWITSGDAAGVLVTWARTQMASASKASWPISCFLVPQGAPGLTFGRPEEKMGLMASHTVAVNFQDVFVPAHHLLGEVGQGLKIALSALDGGRIGIGAQAVGLAEAALEVARGHLGSAGQTPETRQGALFALADMATYCEAAWLLTLRAAELKEKQVRHSREAAMAKLFASESANQIIAQAMDIVGLMSGHGDHRLAQLFRDARVTRLYEGTSEIQRVVVAREELRLLGAA